MSMQKIRKGDKVVVLTGKDKGRNGQVTQVMPKDGKAIVAGVNMIRRHTKQTAQSEGGIIQREAPIDLSNIAILDPKDGKATRVGFTMKDGKKVRVAKRSGAMIDG
jgi:large subunit ribosomal protein L24